jgi:hypothetical protein
VLASIRQAPGKFGPVPTHMDGFGVYQGLSVKQSNRLGCRGLKCLPGPACPFENSEQKKGFADRPGRYYDCTL